ncbi:hypothetical protein ACFW1A_01020 [Kitasatospora sp. NPDC058965]|uniref:hypothetical protein n=1 Tax=Kitasatospora sp. NPDC058965 TaxID=3346682 RepID=UPI0036962083
MIQVEPGEPDESDSSESPTGSEALEPAKESPTMQRLRAQLWPERIPDSRIWH